uniref:Uncharacterized protein n=1 Tax=Simulacricoccus ruber TaxID=2303410 RepID=A0A3S7UVI7_9BACT|nr:hypothetical protein [Simulacricoccus ruber]
MLATDAGLLLWRESKLRQLDAPSARYLRLISNGDGVWAATDAGILDLQPGRWSQLPAPPVGASPQLWAHDGILWASGFDGLATWEGGKWQPRPAPRPGARLDLHGPTGTDLWAWEPTHWELWHFDGTRWESRKLAVPDQQHETFAIGPDGSALLQTTTWPEGAERTVWRWTDGGWARSELLPTPQRDSLAWVDGELWAVGYQASRWTGSSWSPVAAEHYVHSLASAGGELWALGGSPLGRSGDYLGRLDGARFVTMHWSLEGESAFPEYARRPSLAPGPRHDYLAGGTPALWSWDGREQRLVTELAEPWYSIDSVTTGADGRLWLTGSVGADDNFVAEWRGTEPVNMLSARYPFYGGRGGHLLGTPAVGPGGEAWSTGDRGTLFHWTGARWEEETLPGIGAEESLGPVMVTEDGPWVGLRDTADPRAILRRTASGWERLETPLCVGPCSVTQLVGRGARDVWAATSEGVRHWDGERWASILDRPARLSWFAADDVWLLELRLGLGLPDAAHWDGQRWTPHWIGARGPISTKGGLSVFPSTGLRLAHQPGGER